MSGLVITDVDPRDEAAFDAWQAVYEHADRHGREELATPWARQELWLKMTEPSRRSWKVGLVGRVGDEVVVTGDVEAPLLDNLDLAEVHVAVHPDHRRLGHGTAMLAHIEALVREKGRRILIGETPWAYGLGPDGAGAPGREFARARGFDLVLSDVQRRLALPVAEERLDALAAEAAPYHRAYTLRSFVGPVPEELLHSWAELIASLVTEAPTGDREVEPEAVDVAAVREDEALIAKQNRAKYSTMALDAAGEVVAFTDVAASGYQPGRVFQWGTLVRPAHRGHRLGMAVKVANLRLLQRERPEATVVITWNAEVNDHMVAVNEKLGFLPAERSGELQKKLC